MKVEIFEDKVLLDLRRHREEFYEKTKHLSPEALCELIDREAENFLRTHNLSLPRVTKTNEIVEKCPSCGQELVMRPFP
jgi:hypothetical protein